MDEIVGAKRRHGFVVLFEVEFGASRIPRRIGQTARRIAFEKTRHGDAFANKRVDAFVAKIGRRVDAVFAIDKKTKNQGGLTRTRKRVHLGFAPLRLDILTASHGGIDRVRPLLLGNFNGA